MPFKKGERPPGSVQWQKGVSGNANGRPKDLMKAAKRAGQTNDEILTQLRGIISMTLPELKAILADEESKFSDKLLVSAFRKDLDRGNLDNLFKILDRLMGKPTETAKVTSDNKVEVHFVKGKTIL